MIKKHILNFQEFINEKSFESLGKKAEILEKYEKNFHLIFNNIRVIFENDWPDLWKLMDFLEIEDEDIEAEMQEEILYGIAKIMKNNMIVDSKSGGLKINTKELYYEIEGAIRLIKKDFDLDFMIMEDEIYAVINEFISKTQTPINRELGQILEDLKKARMDDFNEFYKFIRNYIENIIEDCINIKKNSFHFDSRDAIKMYTELVKNVQDGKI